MSRDILLAGEAGLLDDMESDVGMPKVARDKTADGVRTLAECMYYHDLVLVEDDVNKLLNSIQDNTHQARNARRNYVTLSATLQNKILTAHILVEATRLVEEHRLKGEDLLSATDARLDEVFETKWAVKPEMSALRMWHPLRNTINFNVMYNPPEGVTIERKRLMQKWRIYNFNCYVRAMRAAIRLRLTPVSDAADSPQTPKRQWATHWQGMIHASDFTAPPALADVPIRPGKGYNKLRKEVVPTVHPYDWRRSAHRGESRTESPFDPPARCADY